MQVDIMSGLSEQLRVKQVGQSLAHFSFWIAGKGASKVSAVARVAALSSEESRFVENRDQNDCPMQRVRAPALSPRAQDCRSLVFVAMRTSIDQDDRTGCSHPNPRIEADIASSEAATVETRGECFQIKTRFRHRNSHG